MKTKSWFRLLLMTVAVLVLGVTACQKTDPAGPQGTVKANEAYLTLFGQPPVPEQGQCFARVGFYPLQGSPGKVGAIPFFLFKEVDQLPLLLERLVNNEAVFPSQTSLRPLFNPFPPGSSVRLLSQAGDTVELELSLKESLPAENIPAVAAALTETATQFAEIKKVRIVLDGAPLSGMPEGGFVHDSERIIPPGSPDLLLVVGGWEKGSQDPEEILAEGGRRLAPPGTICCGVYFR